MVRRDPHSVDLAQQKLKLADDIVVWPVRERGECVYRIEIPTEHKFFRVGYEEYVFISLLDGQTTIPQACGLAAATLRDRAPTASQAESIQRWLLRNNLAYLPTDGPPRRGHSRTPGDKQASALWTKFNPFWMKLPLCKPGHRNSRDFIAPMARSLRWIFSPIVVVLGILLILIALFTLAGHWNRFAESSTQIFSSTNWIWLLGWWVVLKIVHELAHAVACQRHGGEVRELGLVFILFAPMAYVDVTSCWRMTSRWPRIAVASAGMFVELTIAAVAILVWANSESQQTQFLLHNLVFTAGLSTILFNANALMRFDGYFILADLIEIPNLYGESMQEIKRIAKRIVTGQHDSPGHYIHWRLWFLRLYGAAALIWKVVICVTLAITAAAMFSGAGVIIAAIGVLLWLGQPLGQLQKHGKELFQRDTPRFIRGVVVGSAILSAAIATVCWMPIPTAVKVPAVVTFLPETLVRSRTDGFVRAVHVVDSMQVKSGDLLIEIDNPELQIRLYKLRIALEQNKLRYRAAINQRDASAQLVLQEKTQSLIDQIDQVQRHASGLKVIAHRDGQIVGRDLAQLVGSYVHEGDLLLMVAAENEKELLAVVHQDYIEEARSQVGATIPIRTCRFDPIEGKIRRVDPRATHRLAEPSLSAIEGGPLAVRQASDADGDDGDQEYRLLEPHFPARIQLSSETARTLPAGMRMEASIGYRRDPIITRLVETIRRLWQQANDVS
ncbi:MAG: biotin/lipoyl-binding protein [Pirellulaceae bacterium]|nr:biotin/lipoyl-binding protein [Pirellulaceae bacterium]